LKETGGASKLARLGEREKCINTGAHTAQAVGRHWHVRHPNPNWSGRQRQDGLRAELQAVMVVCLSDSPQIDIGDGVKGIASY